MRTPGKKTGGRVTPPAISARLGGHITLEIKADGSIAACFDGYSVGLGKFSASVAERALELRTGLPLASFAASRAGDREVDLLVRRLAQSGLLEYRFGRARADKDQLVIEPQVPDYWPRTPKLVNKDVIVLSRFAYLRRRGNEMVLESPRAGALFRICDPKIAAALALLSTPQKISALRREPGFPGLEFLALLVDCQILFKIETAKGNGLRPSEGDDNLVLWDFHDLLFHTHSTEGRQANPLGGLYPYAGLIPPPPAVRPRWPGKAIDLSKVSVNRSVWKGKKEDRLQYCNGRIISGRFGQKGEGKFLEKVFIYVPYALRSASDFANRGCLPHHDEIAVDLKEGTNKVYTDKDSFADAYERRRGAALSHLGILFQQWEKAKRKS